MSEDAHKIGFTRLAPPMDGWRCDRCGALTHIPGDHAARCANRVKTSVYPPDGATLYMETCCPACDRLKAELAEARECIAMAERRAQEATALRADAHGEAGRLTAELAKLRALCAAEADRLQDFCDTMEGERLWESTILASIENLKASRETRHEP